MEGLAPGVGGAGGGVKARVAWEDKYDHRSEGVGRVVVSARVIFSALIVKESKGTPSPVWDKRPAQEERIASSICKLDAAMRDMVGSK